MGQDLPEKHAKSVWSFLFLFSFSFSFLPFLRFVSILFLFLFLFLQKNKKSYSNELDFIDENDCYSNPCEAGGTCVDGLGTYKCYCPAGRFGERCESSFLSFSSYSYSYLFFSLKSIVRQTQLITSASMVLNPRILNLFSRGLEETILTFKFFSFPFLSFLFFSWSRQGKEKRIFKQKRKEKKNPKSKTNISEGKEFHPLYLELNRATKEEKR